MNYNKTIALLFFIGFGFASWGPKNEDKKEVIVNQPYFDINSYMDDYFLSHDVNRSVIKLISIDDLTEKKVIKNYSIERDLIEFRNRNISRPKFQGKFEMTNEQLKNGLSRTIYKSIDPKTKIRSYSIIRDKDDNVQTIQIVELKNSALVNQNNLLLFTPEKGYRITECDSMKILGKKCKTINIKFKEEK